MVEEQRYIVESFKKGFADYKDKKVLLYGLGRNTEAILSADTGFDFIGLMDQNAIGEIRFGYPVLSNEEVVKIHSDDTANLDDRIIVIVARDSVVNIIYNRIEHLYDRYGIRIFDYKGVDLTRSIASFAPMDNPYWNVGPEDLYREISEHDIISFDIFDTLLMRRILEPKDVFRIVEIKLRKEGIDIPFFAVRTKIEAELEKAYPTLDEIYFRIESKYPEYASQMDRIRETEEETDRKQLVPRDELVKALNYAIDMEKQVYLLSDMYYSSEYLEKLLRENNISGYKKIFVSNELRATKEEGTAYDLYKDAVSSDDMTRFLHVGDNRYVDGKNAIEHGLDSFLVYSGYELLVASSMQSLLTDTKELGRRCILGMIVERLFRNPFCLNDSKGVVRISDTDVLGYCFIAPMLVEFVRWLDRIVVEKDIKQLLFTSRDGYLIQMFYRILADHQVKNEYIRISRRCATVAGIKDEGDILRIVSRKYNGTIGDMMKRRFGVDISMDYRSTALISDNSDKMVNSVLEDYQKDIYSESKIERAEYLSYLSANGVDIQNMSENTLVFDFVSSGTVWYNLGRIINKKIKGVCFATMNLPNEMYDEESEDIVSPYGNIRSYGSGSALSKHYLIMESILTDDKDSFVCFKGGECVFEGDGINHKYLHIKPIHDAAIEFCKDYGSLYGDVMSDIPLELGFTDEIFGQLFKPFIIVSHELRNIFVNDDAYDGIDKYMVWE